MHWLRGFWCQIGLKIHLVAVYQLAPWAVPLFVFKVNKMHLSELVSVLNKATCLNSVRRSFRICDEVVIACYLFFFLMLFQSVPLKCINFKFIYKEFHWERKCYRFNDLLWLDTLSGDLLHIHFPLCSVFAAASQLAKLARTSRSCSLTLTANRDLGSVAYLQERRAASVS